MCIIYTSTCQLYTFLFLANVRARDAAQWLESTAVSLAQEGRLLGSVRWCAGFASEASLAGPDLGHSGLLDAVLPPKCEEASGSRRPKGLSQCPARKENRSQVDGEPSISAGAGAISLALKNYKCSSWVAGPASGCGEVTHFKCYMNKLRGLVKGACGRSECGRGPVQSHGHNVARKRFGQIMVHVLHLSKRKRSGSSASTTSKQLVDNQRFFGAF